MSNNYTTLHAIGDLVYTADRNGIDRDVIKAIKITTLKENIEYGIKSKQSSSMLYSLWGYSDGYNWYKPSDILTNKEEAIARHEGLKEKYELDKAKEDAKRKAERKAELKEQLYNLEHGIESDDV